MRLLLTSPVIAAIFALIGAVITYFTIPTVVCKCEFAEVIELTGQDSSGKEGAFTVRVFSQEDRWLLGSSKELESGQASIVLGVYLRNLPELRNAVGVISVGTASKEGNSEVEHHRAERRADLILSVMRPLLNKEQKVYKLNLGKYSLKKEESDTSYQRRVIIIGIEEIEEGLILLEALENALKNQLEPKFDFELNNYENFKLREV